MGTSPTLRVTSHAAFRRLAVTLFIFVAGLLFATMRTATQGSGTVRFAVIGDFGKAGANEASVADRVKSWGPDFIITLGDNNYEYGGADTIDVNIGQYYHDYISPYFGSYGAGADVNRFFPSVGNHDWGDGYVSPPTVKPHNDYFTLPGNERYYDFVTGPVHLFALSSDGFEPDGNTAGSVQATWLQGRLASSTSPWKIAYFHNPPYSSSSHPTGTEESHLRWPFREWGLTAVFAGHHHDYERMLLQNIPYFVNGLGGNGKDNFTFPLPGSRSRYNGDYGAMLVTASPGDITFQFITRTGALVDTYSIAAPAGAGAPNNLVATPVPTGRIDLWWTDNATNEDGFAIERSTDGIQFQEIDRTAASETTYTDITVQAQPTAYSYRVHAFTNDGGTTAASNVATATTVPALPEAPVLTATAPSSSAVALTWTPVSGAAGYRVYRLVNLVFTHVAAVDAGVTQFTDPNRVPLTAYTYVVRAFNDAGESPSSNEGSATTQQRLPTPTGLTATAVTSSQIDLAWTDNSEGEAGFKVFRSTDGVTFTTLAWVGPNVTTFSNTGRTPSTTYHYYVRAYESTGGESLSSNTASATTPAPLAAPGNLAATAVSTSRIDLTWTDNSSTEANFRIYRSLDGVTFAFTGQTGANVTTYSNTGLTTSTTYYYRITAREAGGTESAVSNTAVAATRGLPAAPSGLVATAASSSQIDLTWADNSSNETGFRVDRSTDGVTFTALAWLDAGITSYSNTGRNPATTYYYRVSAFNDSGNSPYSNVASATTPSALAPPSSLQAAAITSTRVDLTWTDNASSESGFKLYRSTDNVTFAFLVTVGANVTSYSNNSAQPATTYYYRVLAYDAGGGQSAFSNTVSVTTPPVPVAPTGLVATAVSSTQINLSWSDNSGNESGFRIDRSPDGVTFTTLAWTGANVTTYANTGRSPGTKYYYRVSAYNANGTSAPSNVASATTP